MILLAGLLLATTPTADTPRAFLKRLYAPYERGDVNPLRPWSRIYTRQLVREMELNGRLHGDQEVGLIDFDPLCQCQDMAGLKARIGQVAAAGPAAAIARVSVSLEGESSYRALRIRLARTPNGWRIADIGTQEQASLLGELRRDNAAMRRRRR